MEGDVLVWVDGRKGTSGEGPWADWLAEENVSIFESVRSYDGVLFRLREHFDRLFASAQTVGFKIPKTRAELQKILYAALKHSGRRNAFLRMTMNSRGVFVIVASRAYPRAVYESGIRLQTSVVKKSSSRAFYPEAKTSCYGAPVLATMELPPDTFEALFLSEEGYVRETRTSNVFAVRKEVLQTPPSVGILEGVTRRVILELARDFDLPAEEVYLTRHDLFNADEVFLTHTSGELVPVREIDGRRIGRRVPGPWTQRLSRSFRNLVHRNREETLAKG